MADRFDLARRGTRMRSALALGARAGRARRQRPRAPATRRGSTGRVETEHFIIYYWEPLDDVARARRRRRGARAPHAVAGARSPAGRQDDHLPRRRHRQRERLRRRAAAQRDPALRDRPGQLLRARRPRGLAVRPRRARVHAHPPPRHDARACRTSTTAIFGKTWAPNQIMPRWMIEGIAVYEESKRSAGGRNRGTRFDEYIRIARHAGQGPAARRGQRRAAPVPARQRGLRLRLALPASTSSIASATTRCARWRTSPARIAPPFAINRQIAKVVGKPFTELYDDWKLYLRDRYGMQEMARRAPRPARRPRAHALRRGQHCAALRADGRELVLGAVRRLLLPTVRAMPVGGDAVARRARRRADRRDGPVRPVARWLARVRAGPRSTAATTRSRTCSSWDAQHASRSIRLTHGARARDPAVSPDGRSVAFSQNEHSDERARGDGARAGRADRRSCGAAMRYDQAYQPVWSPDGTRIAFSAWRTGGYRDILVVELASGAVDEVTHDRAIDMSPAWSSRRALPVLRQRPHRHLEHLRVRLARAPTWQVTNVARRRVPRAAVARRQAPGVRGARWRTGGYDLYELPLDPTHVAARARRTSTTSRRRSMIRDDEARVSPPRPYRAARDARAADLDARRSTSATSPSASDPDRRQRRGRAARVLARGRDRPRAAATRTSARRTATPGFRPGIRFAGARTLVAAQRLAHRRRVDELPRGGLGRRRLSLSIPFESRPSSSWSLSFDYSSTGTGSVGDADDSRSIRTSACR